jgi:leucyl aminopeptidase
MSVKIITQTQLATSETIALGVTQEKPVTYISKHLHTEVKSFLALGDFKGKADEIAVLYPKGIKVKRILLCGLGKEKNLDLDRVRKSVAIIMKKAAKMKLKTVAFAADSFILKKLAAEDVLRAISTMGGIAPYAFQEHKTSASIAAKDPAPNVLINGSAQIDSKKISRESEIISEAVNFARTLGNRPANQVYPQILAQEAKRLGTLSKKLQVRVLQKPELIRKGFGALLSVGKGSQRPPVLIELKYQGGKKGKAPIALVGKGITFDSGGISLKPSNKMDEMRYDMCGAATVLGIFKAVAKLGLPINLIGVIPAAENMPSGSASRPGDIVKSLSGKTIEILNTDAEGRLILADAITYAKKHNPVNVIDFATLTGAVIVALGSVASGVISNNQKLADEIIQAGNDSGERVWQLPLWDEYRELVKSDNADVANIGNRPGAGTIVGGAFLEKFVEKTPWVHVDIAGTAWGEAGPIYSKGATGVGVRLIIEWLKKVK